MKEFSIRPAHSGDEDTVVALLRALAEYEQLLGRFHITASPGPRTLKTLTSPPGNTCGFPCLKSIARGEEMVKSELLPWY